MFHTAYVSLIFCLSKTISPGLNSVTKVKNMLRILKTIITGNQSRLIIVIFRMTLKSDTIAPIIASLRKAVVRYPNNHKSECQGRRASKDRVWVT